jgi:hypothetical protein
MSSDRLPPDLRELEARLAQRSGPEPSPELRARLLSAVDENLAQPKSRSRAWRIAGWAAASVVLLNMTMSIANGLRYHRLAEATNVEPGARPRPEAPDAGDSLERYAASALASLRPSSGSGFPERSLFGR